MRVYGRPPPNRRVYLWRWIVAGLVLATLGYGASRLITDHAQSARSPTAVISSRRGSGTTSQGTRQYGSPTLASSAVTTEPPPNKSAPPRQPVPILMYHVIASPPAGAPYPDLYLSPDLFRAQIHYLWDNGYHAVTLDEVWRYWHDRLRLPAHPIVLSFDDGYLSQYSVAARLLRRYRWPGVLNLAVSHLHEGSYGLSVGRVNKMIADGWEVDSHTVHHVDLVGLPAAELHQEVADSRAILRRLFHQPVLFFCYPAGRYDAAALAAVHAAGYLGATTTNPGFASPHGRAAELELARIEGLRALTPGLDALSGLFPIFRRRWALVIRDLIAHTACRGAASRPLRPIWTYPGCLT